MLGLIIGLRGSPFSLAISSRSANLHLLFFDRLRQAGLL
jgi:hypothetical protein